MKRIISAVTLLSLLCLWSVSDGAPPQTKRVYDRVYGIAGDTVKGASVKVELLSPDSTKIAYDSVSGFSLGKNPPPFDTTTDNNGYYGLTLIPNSHIIPHGSRYQITVTAGRRQVYSVRVNLTATSDSVLVRSIQ